MTGSPCLVIFVLLLSLLSACALGQSQPPVSATAGAPPQAPSAESEREIQRREQSQRILGLVPMFGVTSRHNAPPLTPAQKFHLFAKGAFDPFEYVAVGIQAGIGQAQDEFPSYGQGAAGYAKRYGAAAADEVSSQFFSNFAYPVLLKQDPRYFRSGQGPIKRRILYSLAQEFACRSDRGTRTFAWSNMLGALSSGGLSNLYYPPSDRGFSLTVSRAAIALIYGSAGGLLEEFWPDIHRRLFHKKGTLSSASTDRGVGGLSR